MGLVKSAAQDNELNNKPSDVDVACSSIYTPESEFFDSWTEIVLNRVASKKHKVISTQAL